MISDFYIFIRMLMYHLQTVCPVALCGMWPSTFLCMSHTVTPVTDLSDQTHLCLLQKGD